LHVANEPFAYDSNHSAAGAAANGGKEEKAETKSEDGNAIAFDPSVHITNCCANSHDSSKFIGEICVDLETKPPPQHRCPDPHGIHRSCDVNNYEHDDDESSANTSLIIDNCTRQDELSSPFSTSMSPPLPLGEYLPSISASVASVASSFGPFLRGGEANCGFEYLGLDFVLSSVEENGQGGEKYDDNDMISWKDSNNGYDNKSSSTKRDSCRRRPVAYLLESNAPPSQDTASGLQHAEALHDEVITDLLRMWVLPNVVTGSSKSTRPNDDGDEAASPSHDRLDCSGWKCVYTPPKPINANSASGSREKSLILPSKAAILNRIRWALFETRASKEYNMAWKKLDENRSRCDTLLLTGPSTLSTSPALLSRYGEMNTDEDGKNITPAEQFCESSSSGMKKVVSFSFGYHRTDEFVSFVRSQFPYYSTDTTANNIDTTRVSSSSIAACNNAIFFESGGGAQVPQLVANAVVSSLSYRDRSVIGRNVQKKARMALCSLLANNINTSTSLLPKHTHDDDDHVVIMGSNASSLLELLARRMYESGLLCQGDEIVLSSENHLANVTPWLDLAARTVGEDKVKWWTITANTSDIATSKKHDHCVKDRICMTESSSCILSDLITHRTKIVAISHVSNVLGLERDVPAICDLVHRKTKGRGHVVVDGVAAAPHLLSSKAINATKIRGRGSPEWYVVSLHKLFGPHLGCLIGTRSIMEQMRTHSVNKLVVCREENRVEPYSSLLSNDLLAESWESGTMNYEGCSGAIALLSYVEKIGIKAYESYDITCSSQQTSNQITSETSGIPISSYVNIASLCIQHVEDRLVCRLLDYLHSCTFVRIIQDVGEMKVTNHDQGNGSNNLRRIPIISFTHANISSQAIVEHCRYQGVVCRAGKFLSTDRLWEELMIDEANVVRFSLAHYNTLGEIEASIRILEGMEGWH
jgi:selenocysteine lyase/cysteine desulfurase